MQVGNNSDNNPTDLLVTIKDNCSQFINSSDGLPIIKHAPHQTQSIRKIKVRFRKNVDKHMDTFNEAFSSQWTNIRQRAVFVHGDIPPNVPASEAFYVFPVDGFRFMYNTEISTSSTEYQDLFGTMVEQFGDDKTANELLLEILQYTYTTENLSNGIYSGSELIIYNIPHYYIVNISDYCDYSKLLTSLV